MQDVILARFVKPVAISKLEIMNTLESIKFRAFTNTYMKMKIVLNSFTFDCFSILDTAQTEYQLKINKGMYIDWEQANLNKKLITWPLHFLFNILFYLSFLFTSFPSLRSIIFFAFSSYMKFIYLLHICHHLFHYDI